MIYITLLGHFHTRRERCLKETEGFFAPAVTSLFIRSKGVADSEKAVEQVDMMVDVMKRAFKENLERYGNPFFCSDHTDLNEKHNNTTTIQK